MKRSAPKIAIVCDWLTNMGGAERVVLALHEAFPDAPIYTSVFDPAGCPAFAKLDVRTTWLQRLPAGLRNRHQLWPVLRSFAFKRLDLSQYDIVISSASAEAKAVRVRAGAKHICYCHTPTRYYWSHYQQYQRDPGFGRLNPLVRRLLPLFVGWMRRRDLAAVRGVDLFIANSREVQARIKQYYQRDSVIVFPPVDVAHFRPAQPVKKQPYYLMLGRQIPYKRFDLAIAACNQLGRRLVIIGNGSEHAKLRALAGPTIEFLTDVDDTAKVGYLQQAQAFLFPGREDFGISPVEALAAGTPVIAYAAGGALDYVIEGKNGILFGQQTAADLAAAVERFEQSDPPLVGSGYDRFDQAKFITAIQAATKP